jgi:hypothetical protein
MAGRPMDEWPLPVFQLPGTSSADNCTSLRWGDLRLEVTPPWDYGSHTVHDADRQGASTGWEKVRWS